MGFKIYILYFVSKALNSSLTPKIKVFLYTKNVSGNNSCIAIRKFINKLFTNHETNGILELTIYQVNNYCKYKSSISFKSHLILFCVVFVLENKTNYSKNFCSTFNKKIFIYVFLRYINS